MKIHGPYQTSKTIHKEHILANRNVLRTHSTCLAQVHRRSCPTAKGNRTLNPSCFMTLAYIGPSVDGDAGLTESKSEPDGMKPYISTGAMNGPRTLPMTTSMMAAASSPPEFLVMTTLDAIVVGIALTTTMPASMVTSIAPDVSPPAAITIRITAICCQRLLRQHDMHSLLSMRTGITMNPMPWTRKCKRQLVMCSLSFFGASCIPLMKNINAIAP